MSNWQTKSCLKLGYSGWDQPRGSLGPNTSFHGPTSQLHRLLCLPGRGQALPRQPGPGHRITFHKGVKGQGAPAGLVFRLHHHHHIEAITGKVFALQDGDDDIITTIIMGSSMSSSAPSFYEIPTLGQKLC